MGRCLPVQRSVLRLLQKSGIFTYEMANFQGNTAMDGGVKKHGHGGPLLLTRPHSNFSAHFISEIRFFA